MQEDKDLIKKEARINIFNYCTENNIKFAEPFFLEGEYIFSIDLSTCTEDQFVHITNLAKYLSLNTINKLDV